MMTDIKSNSYLPLKKLKPDKDTELDSINFRNSLRFFQKQLANRDNSEPNCPNVKINKLYGSYESLKMINLNENESRVTFPSSRIQPIPTADTILESVRILRAIQKSQEKRGEIWTLDFSTTNSQALDPYVLSTGINSVPQEADSVSTLIESAKLLEPLAIPEVQPGKGCSTSDSHCENHHSKFWPPKSFDIKLPIADSETIEQKSDNEGSDETVVRLEESTQGHSEKTLISRRTLDDGHRIPRVRQDCEDTLNDYLYSDLNEDTNVGKLDLLLTERSISAEFDSGMGTDKSIDSLRGDVDVERDLWSDSSNSHYASAVGSPCESLSPASPTISYPEREEPKSDVAVEIASIKNERPEEQNVSVDQCTLSTPPKVILQSDGEISLASLSVEERPTCYYPVNESDSAIFLHNEQEDNDEYQDTKVCDISRDRLIEVVEAKIQQLAFDSTASEGLDKRFTETITDKCSSETVPNAESQDSNQRNADKESQAKLDADRICDSTPQVDSNGRNLIDVRTVDGIVTSEDQASVVADALVEDDIETIQETRSGETVPHKVIDNFNLNNAVDEGDTKLGKRQNDTLHADNNGTEDIIDSEPTVPLNVGSDGSSSDQNVISTFTAKGSCDLGSHNVSSEEDTIGQDHDPKRLKTNVTVSWDPVILIKRLYDVWKDTKLKQFELSRVGDAKGVWNVLSVGSFVGRDGLYCVKINNGHFYCYQEPYEDSPIVHFPLHYSKIKSVDETTFLLDSKLGRSVQVKFETADEKISWQNILQSQCYHSPSSSIMRPIPHCVKSNKKVIIIDLGSCSTRAGILMDPPSLPSLYFPTVCAVDKNTGNRCYGMEALNPDVRKYSTLSFPLRPSLKVTKFAIDVDQLKELFTKIFNELNIDPRTYRVQIAIPRNFGINTQVALLKLLLEDLKVKAVSLTGQALLTLYANNVSTAIAVDIGDRLDVFPVADGFIIDGAVRRISHGSQTIIHHMKHALAQKHISLSNDIESFVVQHICESLCYVASNYEEELTEATSNPKWFQKSISLHKYFEGDMVLSEVTLDTARFAVPEGLFNPDLWGLDNPGVHKLVHQAIQASGMDVRKRLAENIYVSGGVTLIAGFVERLQAEVAKLTHPNIVPVVHSSPYRCHMAYLGACQLASSPSFSDACVELKEWQSERVQCLNKWHL